MSQAIPAVQRQFRGKLARTMLWILLPLSVLPLLILGWAAYLQARNTVTSQIETTLQSAEQHQTEQLDIWITDREHGLTSFPLQIAVTNAIQTLNKAEDLTQAEYSAARATILGSLAYVNQQQQLFNQFLVVSLEGEVLIASRSEVEGAVLSDFPYYDDFSEEQLSLLVNAPEPFSDKIAVISTAPFYDNNGNLLAILWGITEHTLIEEFLTEINFLNSRIYFVTNRGEFLRIGDTANTDMPTTIIQPSEEQAELFLNPRPTTVQNVVELESNDGVAVLAAYSPVDRLKAGFISELPSATTQAQLNALIPFFVGLLVIIVLVSIGLNWLSTRQIIQPLLDLAMTARHFADGDWQKRAIIDRNDEIGLLAHSFNQMADELSTLYRSLETQVATRTQQIRTAAEVAQFATSSTSQDELLQKTVQLIVERFNFDYSAIFLLDEFKEYAVLQKAYSVESQFEVKREHNHLPVGTGSIVGMVASSNRPYVAADIANDPYYLPVTELPLTRSEAVIPMSIGDQVLGVLGVQSNEINAFEADSVTTLQTLAHQIASALQNISLLENTRVDLQATFALYQASHRIAESNTTQEVLNALTDTIQHTPFISALLEVTANGLQTLAMTDPIRGEKPSQLPFIPLSRQELASSFTTSAAIRIDGRHSETALPHELIDMPQQLGCEAFQIYPIMPEGTLSALLILGATDAERFTAAALEPYSSLVDITRTALEKVQALANLQERLIELETLGTVGQSISAETNLNALYEIIHQQILQVMGDVNFLIAIYSPENDTLSVPYMDEGGEITSVAPFPLGQGLTSIVIRSCQPLMIVENTIERSRALGAIVTEGGEAKSWLGVPLLIGNEPIGAIVVQDLETEYRFDDDDLRLLLTLASQVAIAIRNAHLMENTERTAQQDRQLLEITGKIRHSPDIQGILKTTAQEIGLRVGVRRAHIQIKVDPIPPPAISEEERTT